MKRKRKTKVASILKVSPEYIIELWLCTLPVDVKMSQVKEILEHSKRYKYILWAESIGFTFFK